MMNPRYQPQFLAAIRHEAGHIVAALLVLFRIRSSTACQNGWGATDFVQPQETITNNRLKAIWDYVTASPRTVSLRWAALQRAFLSDQPLTAHELRFAYRAITVLMAGTIAEGDPFPYHRGNSALDIDDATKAWSLVALLDIPVAEVRELEAHLQTIMPTVLPIVTAAFSRQHDGAYAYVHSADIERALRQHPAATHRLLRRPSQTPPLVGVIAMGALAFVALRAFARSA